MQPSVCITAPSLHGGGPTQSGRSCIAPVGVCSPSECALYCTKHLLPLGQRGPALGCSPKSSSLQSPHREQRQTPRDYRLEPNT